MTIKLLSAREVGFGDDLGATVQPRQPRDTSMNDALVWAIIATAILLILILTLLVWAIIATAILLILILTL